MLCDKCKQREANIHIKQSVNGDDREKFMRGLRTGRAED